MDEIRQVLGQASRRLWVTDTLRTLTITACIVLTLLLGEPAWLTGAVVFLSLLLIWQHRQNITKLTSGTERRLGEKA